MPEFHSTLEKSKERAVCILYLGFISLVNKKDIVCGGGKRASDQEDVGTLMFQRTDSLILSAFIV